jgi:hypothetical protein
VTSKPDHMSDVDWDWLNELSFGCIIFSNPRKGMMSMPERIAGGDLDGDLYLVCWDENILSYMNAEPLVDQPAAEEDGRPKEAPANSRDDWLQNAQELMVDASQVNDVGKLTGTLYKLAEKSADNSRLFLKDPDACAFADAYKQALEFTKHGRPIYLPKHLHDKLPKALRTCVTDCLDAY